MEARAARKKRTAPLPKGAVQVYKTNLTNGLEMTFNVQRQSYNLLFIKQIFLTICKLKVFSKGKEEARFMQGAIPLYTKAERACNGVPAIFDGCSVNTFRGIPAKHMLN